MLTFSGVSQSPATSSATLRSPDSRVPISLKQLPEDFKRLPDGVKETIIPREALIQDIVVFRKPTTPKNIGTQLTRLRFLEYHEPPEDERNYALLQFSIRKNYPPLFKTLLKTIPNPDMGRLLRMAVQGRNEQAFDFLLKKSPGPLPPENLDETLQCLADYGQPEKLRQLLECQPENPLPPERLWELQALARAQREQINARLPQHQAIMKLFQVVENGNPENPEDFRRMIALLQKPDLNFRKRKRDENDQQYGLLSAAIYAGNLPAVRALLADSRFQVNTGKNNKPLHVALAKGIDMVNILLEIPELDVNLGDEEKATPLHWVACGHDSEVVDAKEILLTLLKMPGIDVNAPDNEGYTPLHWAVMGGKHDMVRIMLEKAKGLNVNQKNYDHNTPLHTAIDLNQPEVVKILLQDPEIDIYAQNRDQFTPLAYANQYEQTEIAELLREHGATE